MEPNQLDLFKDTPVEPQQLELFAYPPPPPPPGQVELFPSKQYKSKRRSELVMNSEELQRWKTQIINYQQKARETPPPQQAALFDLPPDHCDPDKIDPLTLQLQSMAFYRIPADYSGEVCLYFVVDSAAKLILYVGETLRSNKRWKQKHDCKDYIASYQDLHYRYKLKTAVNIAFWWDTPTDTKKRQQLEQDLIQKWRSPFNKQMWSVWSQPFKKD
ncbi:MAG: GIY-YIG nuclease family protein [Cyanobacteria bacterium P01_D01_bin.116]